jgi:NitT/TauT family transport system permease protein
MTVTTIAKGDIFRRSARPRRPVPGFVLSWALLIVLIGLWQLAVSVFHVSSVLVPGPTAVARALVDGFQSGYLPKQTWITLKEVLLGFGLAVVLALVSAALVTQFRTMDKAFFPILVIVQTIPKVAMAPLLVMWFGIGLQSKVWTIALIAYFPLLINAILGLRSAEPEQIDMLKSFGAGKFQILRRLQLPSALPHIFAGLDVAVILSVTGAIVAEFVGSSEGLGYAIQATNFNLDTATTFAIVVMLSVIGMTFHAVVVLINRRLVFWSPAQNADARAI